MGKNFGFYAFLLLVAAWSLAYKLDMQPVFLWDESRQANNALEMANSGNFSYPTFQGQPDFWNTKPHLLIALQAMAFKIFGPNELALRLPTWIAAVLIMGLWLRFFRLQKMPWAAFIFTVIILGCRGFNVYHVCRTGDYDALLLLFLSWVILELYAILFEGEMQSTSIYTRLMLGVTLALLTKSLAAAIWLPIVGLLILFLGQNRLLVFKNIFKKVWIPILGIGGYYLTREWATPGYLQAVWENEIAGRYFRPNEGHVTEWYYYFEELYTHYFQGFVWLLIPAVLGLFYIRKKGKGTWYFLLAGILFALIISLSATRISWYMAPLVLLLSVFIGVTFQKIIDTFPISKWMVLPLIFFLVFWQFPLLWQENTTIDGVQPRVVLQRAARTGRMPFQGKWLCEAYHPLELFYSPSISKKGSALRVVEKFEFEPTDTVMLYQWHLVDSLMIHNYARQIHAPEAVVPIWTFVVDSSRIISVKTEKF